MKAQGNKLSPHEVVKVTLLTDEEAVTEDTPTTPPAVPSTAAQNVATAAEAAPKEKHPPTKTETETQGNEDARAKPKPRPKVDLEITNPDDIRVDDKGQMGLF